MQRLVRWSVCVVVLCAMLGCEGTRIGVLQEGEAVPPGYAWVDHAEGELDLLFDGRRVLRYMHAFDDSTEETLHETYKPFHHVFDAAGEHMLTKGSGGLYTHHRGLYIGWNRTTWDGQEQDFWHMKGVTQRHAKTIELTASSKQARQVVHVGWYGTFNEPVISEQRTITVYRQEAPGLLMLDFESQLTPLAHDVLLNGDPEHAGFQYRAHNDVADGPAEVKATYLFHEEEIDPKEDHNLPWAAMNYGLNGRRYSVQHLNHPGNPDSTIYSAYRDYGRFGAFPKVEIKKGETLTLRYRVYVEEGDMLSREAMAARYDEFAKK